MASGTMGAVAGQRPWTADEEAILRAEWPRGAALPDLAGRLDRSQSAVMNRLAKLGITRDSAPVVTAAPPETVLAVAEQHGPAESNGAVDLPTVTVSEGAGVYMLPAGGEIRLPATLGDWALTPPVVAMAREPDPEPAAAIPGESMTPTIPAAEADPVADLLAAATSVASLVGKLREMAATASAEATAPLQAIIDRQAGLLAAYQEALAGRGPVAPATDGEARDGLKADLEGALVSLERARDDLAHTRRERDTAENAGRRLYGELEAMTRERDEARAAVAALEANLAAAQDEVRDLKNVGRLVAGDGVLRSQVQAQRTLIRQLCIMLAVRQDLVPRVEAARELNMTIDGFRAALERAAQGGQVAVETGGEVKL